MSFVHLQAYGRGLQVPKRIYTIEELRLNKIEPEKLLSPTDESLNYVRNVTQGAAAAGLAALAYFTGGWQQQQQHHMEHTNNRISDLHICSYKTYRHHHHSNSSSTAA